MKNKALTKVFGWMFLGLLITFITGYTVSFNANIPSNIYGKYYILFVIVQLVVAFILHHRITKLSVATATCLYLFYAFLTGLTFSFIFVAYELSTIIYVFLATSLIFGIFALIGRITKIDLSKISTYLMMMLIGIIVLEIINIFLANNTINMLLSIVGIVVFVGFIAYDVQKISRNEELYIKNRNYAIIGAFSLYIDFINIFIDLLNLFGSSRD